MSEKVSAMQNSADIKRSADSLGENQGKLPLKQVNYKNIQRKIQQKEHTKIDIEEHQSCCKFYC